MPPSRSGEKNDAGLRRLTGSQLRRVLEAAQQLRPSAREKFLRTLDTELSGSGSIGDGDLARQMHAVLKTLYLERNVRL